MSNSNLNSKLKSIANEKDIKRILFGATVLLGNNGENWSKKITYKDGKYSAEGAIFMSGMKLGFSGPDSGTVYRYACNLVQDLGYYVPSLALYNDDPKTTFSNIKEVFQVGINRL